MEERTLNINLPEDLVKFVEWRAKQRGRTVEGAIAEIIRMEEQKEHSAYLDFIVDRGEPIRAKPWG